MARLEPAEECAVCGVTEPHTHTDLAWDETWGLVQGPEDRIIYVTENAP